MTVQTNKSKLALVVTLMFAFLTASASYGVMGFSQQVEQETDPLKKKPNIVFLVTADTLNYEANKTIPLFAKMLEKEHGYKVKVILGSGKHGSYRYPGLKELSKADLLVIFVRRIALPPEQMNAIKNYINRGKPLIGIRTANHAFNVSGKVEEGFEHWPEFVADILGCENRGYGSAELGADISVIPEAADHPILQNIQTKQWHSKGQLYYVAPLLDKSATVLLEGKMSGKTEPVAWTRTTGKGKVFYTSLGHPADFQTPQFTTLFVNGIRWALH